MASRSVQLAENIPNIDPEIRLYVERIALDNDDDSGRASVYVSSLIHGDIDGDEREDTFLSFAVEGIGGGNFSLFFQALFLEKDGNLVLAAERPNGSFGMATGSSFTPLSIAHGKILGQVHEYAEDDGACCPSIERAAALKYDNGTLTEWIEGE